jgi:hypothetical protein
MAFFGRGRRRRQRKQTNRLREAVSAANERAQEAIADARERVERTERRAIPAPRPSRISIQQQAEDLADEIIAERDRERRISRLGKIYTRFDEVDDVLSNNVETVTRGLFSGNVASLTTMAKDSTLTATQQRYYFQVNDSDGNPQFSLAYGHFGGSGSAEVGSDLSNDTPSRAIYKQYAQTLLSPTDKKFTFNNVDSDSIYIINFNRARIREKLDPGNFEVTLRHISASATTDEAAISSSNHIQIIDDSSLTSATLGESGQVYNLVSGSLDGGTSIHQPTNMVHYGLLYPQFGVAVLDATQLDKKISAGGIDLQTDTVSFVEGFNNTKLFTALSSSAGAVPAGKTGGIQARSSEQVKSTYYFVRAKNAEFNYSNNPSYVTGSLGQLVFNSFKTNPQTYITSVGLYNDRRELLAVAKLSQPLLKNYTREALIKVKLDF